jgi:O-antigen ligase
MPEQPIKLYGQRVDKLAGMVVDGYLFAFVLGCFANSLLVNFTEGNLFRLLTGILIFGGQGRGEPDAGELDAILHSKAGE